MTPTMERHCPNALCDHDNPSDARFCGRCGTPLAGSPPPVPRAPGVSVTPAFILLFGLAVGLGWWILTHGWSPMLLPFFGAFVIWGGWRPRRRRRW